MDLSKEGDLHNHYFVETYAQLREIARRERGKQPIALLETTAVVHEAWLKLSARDPAFNDRQHYLATAALAMRQILIDYARYSLADRRSPEHEVTASSKNCNLLADHELGDVADSILDRKSLQGSTAIELIAIDQALQRLSRIDEALSEFVVLKFFAGLTLTEVADVQGISVRTASREWLRAKALLRVLLEDS